MKDLVIYLNNFVLSKNIFFVKIFSFFFNFFIDKDLKKNLILQNAVSEIWADRFLKRSYLNYRLSNLVNLFNKWDFFYNLIKKKKILKSFKILENFKEERFLKNNQNDYFLKTFLCFIILFNYQHLDNKFIEFKDRFFILFFLLKNNKNIDLLEDIKDISLVDDTF
jgi:hypothetical protein